LKHKGLIIGISAIAIIIAGVSFYRYKASQNKFETLPVVRGTGIEAVYSIGTIEANKTFQAKSGVTAGLARLPVREGEHISKNDIIAVFSEGNAVRAPFDGIISKINFKPGESVFMGNIIAEIIDPKDVILKVILDQRAAIRVKINQPAVISFDGLRDQVFEGTVQSIYSSNSRFNVILKLAKIPDVILPGMTADVSIETGKKENIVMIPAAAVTDGKVTRLRNGKKEMIAVKLGLVNKDKVEALEGDLTESDQVLVLRQ
jgi:membrane fusion protein, macrolide-specific efflux system